MPAPEMQEVSFDTAKPNSVLKFEIKPKTGFVATAKLDLDNDTVAKWKSVEIVGKVIEETLLPPGLYTLVIRIVGISKTPVDIDVEISLKPPKKAAEVQTISFKKKKGSDVCQAIAFMLIA